MPRRSPASKSEPTVWCDVAAINVGVHPRRQDIVDRLAAFGPMSVRDLALWLGAKPSALYHHLKLLMDAGLVVEAGHAVHRRRRELLYATPSRDMRLRLQPRDAKNRAAVQAFAKALGRQIERDFDGGQRAPEALADGPHRNLVLRRVCASPNPRTLAKINDLFDQIAELLLKADGSTEQAVVLTWAMAPMPSGPVERSDTDSAR